MAELRSGFLYTKCYCEENVYMFLQTLLQSQSGATLGATANGENGEAQQEEEWKKEKKSGAKNNFTTVVREGEGTSRTGSWTWERSFAVFLTSYGCHPEQEEKNNWKGSYVPICQYSPKNRPNMQFPTKKNNNGNNKKDEEEEGKNGTRRSIEEDTNAQHEGEPEEQEEDKKKEDDDDGLNGPLVIWDYHVIAVIGGTYHQNHSDDKADEDEDRENAPSLQKEKGKGGEKSKKVKKKAVEESRLEWFVVDFDTKLHHGKKNGGEDVTTRCETEKHEHKEEKSACTSSSSSSSLHGMNPFPGISIPAAEYFHSSFNSWKDVPRDWFDSFRGVGQDPQSVFEMLSDRTFFRFVPTEEFLSTFSSDRSHMAGEKMPAPPYPPISPSTPPNISTLMSLSSAHRQKKKSQEEEEHSRNKEGKESSELKKEKGEDGKEETKSTQGKKGLEGFYRDGGPPPSTTNSNLTSFINVGNRNVPGTVVRKNDFLKFLQMISTLQQKQNEKQLGEK